MKTSPSPWYCRADVIGLVAAALMLVAMPGCQQFAPVDLSAAEDGEVDPEALNDAANLLDAAEFATTGLSIAELNELIADGLMASERALKQKTPPGSPLRRQTAHGIAAASALLVQDDVAPEDKAEAWRSKLKLQFRAASLEWDGYESQLAESVERLLVDERYPDQAEYGNSLLLGLLYLQDDRGYELQTAVDALSDHAQRFPAGNASVKLFLTLARQLADRGDESNSLHTCGVARWLLRNHPEIREVWTFEERLRDGTYARRQKKDELQRLIDTEVKVVRGMMPMKIDSATTLIDIRTATHTIIYVYQVSMDRETVRKKRVEIEASVKERVFKTWQTMRMLDRGIRLRFQYVDADKRTIMAFTVAN